MKKATPATKSRREGKCVVHAKRDEWLTMPCCRNHMHGKCLTNCSVELELEEEKKRRVWRQRKSLSARRNDVWSMAG
jgi:hypothetical protein